MASLSAVATPATGLAPVVKTYALGTALTAGTRDVTTASGDVAIVSAVVWCAATAVTGLVSVAIQTNENPAAAIMTAAEGLVANLLANSVVKNYATSAIVHSGNKIQYTTVGTGLGGSLQLTVTYLPLTNGASI